MRKVYMNNAATTWPKPQEVPDAVYAFMTRDGANALAARLRSAI